MTLETHVLSSSEKTKIVPCVACNRPCQVHVYAANALVKCLEHRGSIKQRTKGRSSVLDPFEPGITLEDRQGRIVGAVINLERELEGTHWGETLTATGIISFDEETGQVDLRAVVGSNLPKFDPRRECGQFRVINRKEVVSVK